jgi:hypothetical protein
MGWFKSRAGSVFHADGPSQEAALKGRGWKPCTEAQAKAAAEKVTLEVESTRHGDVDAEGLAAAQRDEGTTAKKK